MIAFLRSRTGTLLTWLVGLAIGFVFVTQYLGMAPDGEGHGFLVAMFAIAWLGFGAGIVMAVMFALSFFPAAPAAPLRHAGPLPVLSKAKQAKARAMHSALAEAGAFAPEVPDAAMAFPALAADRRAFGWADLLGAYHEAPYYLPEADPARWLANVHFSLLPDGWQTPPAGKVWALLWEDETVIVALVNEGAIDALNAVCDEPEGWSPLDTEAAAQLRQSGFLISTNG